MTDFSIANVVANVFGSDKNVTFDQAKEKAKAQRSENSTAPKIKNDSDHKEMSANGVTEKPLEKQKGVLIHVTKEYVKEHGSTIIGTKGDDVFVIDADVKNFSVKGNGGKDKLILKKPAPTIEFPKLPNEK